MKKQDFTVLKIDDLHPFPDNPFRLVEDDLLMELSESIKEFGVVTPIITRPKEDGNGYETSSVKSLKNFVILILRNTNSKFRTAFYKNIS